MAEPDQAKEDIQSYRQHKDSRKSLLVVFGQRADTATCRKFIQVQRCIDIFMSCDFGASCTRVRSVYSYSQRVQEKLQFNIDDFMAAQQLELPVCCCGSNFLPAVRIQSICYCSWIHGNFCNPRIVLQRRRQDNCCQVLVVCYIYN